MIWSPTEDEALRALYPNAPLAEVLEALPGRTHASVYRRASVFKLKRSQRDRPNTTPTKRPPMKRHVAPAVPPRLGYVKYPVTVIDGVAGKQCTACGWRPLAKFAKHSRCAGGRRHTCTTCTSRDHYAKSPERIIAAVRSWQRRHPADVRINKQAADRRRKARYRVVGRVTSQELRGLLVAYAGICAYCTSPATTFDHVIPLCRDGLHVASNIVPACSPCNSRKHTKTPEEWGHLPRTPEPSCRSSDT